MGEPANRGGSGAIDARGRFRPGSSGNPNGRPKLSAEAREALDILREATPSAARKLVMLLEAFDAKVMLAASLAILERGLGKELAGYSEELSEALASMTPEEALRVVEAAKRNGVAQAASEH